MAAKNSIKQYVSDSWYHLYNRGVEKRLLFLDDQDYEVFISYVNDYLLPKDEKRLASIMLSSDSTGKDKDKARKLLRLKNYAQVLSCAAFCLMPNHFHFLVKQTEAQTIDFFINSLCLRYALYFNRKYNRVGTLFQDRYKAVLVTSEEQLVYLTKYIHRNVQPVVLQGVGLRGWKYSSYPVYLGMRSLPWIKTAEILSFFSKQVPGMSYESFVEQSASESEEQCIFGIEID